MSIIRINMIVEVGTAQILNFRNLTAPIFISRLLYWKATEVCVWSRIYLVI